MIEIICKENDQEEQEIKLPKNIRQVGTPRGRHKIYMEDYVYTYLQNQAKSRQKAAAVLMGKSFTNKDMRYTFIQGAIECGQAMFQFDGIYLDESFWKYICVESQEYFKGSNIVGWFVGEQGEAMHLSPSIESAHRKYFAGRDKVLMLMDAQEDEETFYVYEQGYLQKREGYYIYYEKNIAMQEYMIRKRESAPIMMVNEEEDEEREKPSEWEELHKEIAQGTEKIFVKSSLEEPVSEAEKALQNYRHIMLERRGHKVERKNKRFLYTAVSFFAVAFVMVGAATINNYQKMQKVENVLSVMKTGEEEKKDLVVKNIASEVTGAETPQQPTDVSGAENPQQPADASSAAVPQQPADASSAAAPQQPEQAITEPQYYIVQPGDTLESICLKLYQDKSKVAALCQANGITNGNQIQAGQKLLLP